MDMNLMLGANFTLLGANLTASYVKQGDKGYKILIRPTNLEDNNGITIDEMIKQVNSLIATLSGTAPAQLTEAQVQAKMPSAQAPAGGLKEVRIKLSMIYLYISSEDGQKSKILDFAFKLDLDTSKILPPDIKVIRIDSLSLAVWNTTNKEITDKMQICLPNASPAKA